MGVHLLALYRFLEMVGRAGAVCLKGRSWPTLQDVAPATEGQGSKVVIELNG